MGNDAKKQVRLRDDFWTPDVKGEKPKLLGSKCEACGEYFFPKKEKNWCVYCQTKALTDVTLGREGKLVSYSVVMQQPGGGFYKGPVPYAYGQVDLPEGIRIVTLFEVDNFDDLKVGKDVELVISKLCDNEDNNEVLTFKFRPIN